MAHLTMYYIPIGISMLTGTSVKLNEVYIPTPTFKSKQDLITSTWE